jgi:hypothetical protein
MTTNVSERKRSSGGRLRQSQTPLTPADSLALLRSAVGYVMQAGLAVNAGTVGGALVIKVTGARVENSGGGVWFVPARAAEA